MLEPARDIKKKIRKFAERYPDSDIVIRWLQKHPDLELVNGKIREIPQDAPDIATMNRDGWARRVVGNRPRRSVSCLECCRNTQRYTGAGAIGATVGACVGCTCGVLSGDEDVVRAAAGVGAAAGAAAAVQCPDGVLDATGEFCQVYLNDAARNWGGGGKKKSRKNKKKKRRKTRRKKKKTRRKRKKNRKKRTRRRKR
tara:strand:- start:32 stop:625 length:594 start_codon:yes stop_codon:yes gene_type:complete